MKTFINLSSLMRQFLDFSRIIVRDFLFAAATSIFIYMAGYFSRNGISVTEDETDQS